MNKPIRVYVDHGEAYGNLGDEAMLINALRRLEQHLGKCEFVLPAEPGKPLPTLPANVQLISPPALAFRPWADAIRRLSGVPARLFRLKKFGSRQRSILAWRVSVALLDRLRRLHERGLGPFPCGGLDEFSDAVRRCDAFYGVGAADFNDFFLEGVIYKSWLYRAVRPYVKVSAVSAQGIGPLTTPWARQMAKFAFEHVDLLSFRDCEYSHSFIEELHPRHVRWAICGDEAFSLPAAAEPQPGELLRKAGLPSEAPFIALHFRATDYVKDTTHLIPRIASLLDAICDAVPHYLVFFPLSYHVHSGMDSECGSAIRESMKHPQRFLLAPVTREVQAVKGAVGRARYSLGLSYHLHLFSLSQGHPALGLYTGEYYGYKLKGLTGFYGPPSASINLETADSQQILSAVERIEGTYEEACSSIRQTNDRIMANNDWTLREMALLLKQHA